MDTRVSGTRIAGEVTHVLGFEDERLFYVCNVSPSLEEGWYFLAREGAIGPYLLRSMAEKMLHAYLKFCNYCPRRDSCDCHPEHCAAMTDEMREDLE